MELREPELGEMTFSSHVALAAALDFGPLGTETVQARLKYGQSICNTDYLKLPCLSSGARGSAPISDR
jgi:hypothetical protein